MRLIFYCFLFLLVGRRVGGGGFVLLDGAVEVDKSRFYETMMYACMYVSMYVCMYVCMRLEYSPIFDFQCSSIWELCKVVWTQNSSWHICALSSLKNG